MVRGPKRSSRRPADGTKNAPRPYVRGIRQAQGFQLHPGAPKSDRTIGWGLDRWTITGRGRGVSMRDQSGDVAAPSGVQGQGATPSRREIVRHGVKLAFVAPLLSTFFAREAYAANYSCYPLGHLCDTAIDPERCCPGLQCTGGQPKHCN